MEETLHPDRKALDAGLDHVRSAPRDEGTVELMSRRPAEGEREVVEEAEVSPDAGMVGDNWLTRGSRHTADGSAEPDKQINLMNARVAQLVAGSRDRWALAGDQFYVDLDLSAENVPPGTRLRIGSAELEVTPPPHRGCPKFVKRFGADAMKFVNSEVGRRLNLRGVNARVVEAGMVRTGDAVRKIS
ncbi:MAG: MOSC domain-containing protein [Gemmatimonadetes bacterium]|nr:MOSC domain-containing protein [Gemmatimonadota bacterium]